VGACVEGEGESGVFESGHCCERKVREGVSEQDGFLRETLHR
jgi:hypothetical protein